MIATIRPILGSLRTYGLLMAVVCGGVFQASALDANKRISQFSHTSWIAKDGVPAPVFAIAQTPDGFLWLGTQAGLYKFDGQHFVRWEPLPGKAALSRGAVKALFVSRDGSLWIGYSSNAISRLKDGELKTFTPQEGLHRGGVLSIAEDQHGGIWAGGELGFSRLVDGKWSRVEAAMGYPAPGARQILVDHQGTLWAATDGMNFGLGKDSIRVNTILKLRANQTRFEPTGQAVGYAAQLAEAPNGQVWLSEASGPSPAVRPVEGRSEPDIERAVSKLPLCILFDGEAGLWIGTFYGGLRRTANFRATERAPFDDYEVRDGLSGEHIYALFKDHEGDVWLGTTRGVDRFRENKVTPYSTAEGLEPGARLALAATKDGDVWIVSYPGALVQRVVDTKLVGVKLPAYSASDSTRILSVHARDNHIWLGGSFGLAEGKDRWFNLVPIPGVSVGNTVEAVTSDSTGNLWLAVWQGYKTHIKRGRNGVWTHFPSQSSVPETHCRVLFGDAEGRVWLGYETGEVVVYEKDHFVRYSGADGLPDGKILSITELRGHIWVAGEGGLSSFDGKRFATVTKANGLPGNSVSALLEDDQGSLWIAGDLGIARVLPAEMDAALKSPSYSMRRTFLDSTDGLPGLPRQQEPFPCAVKSADGRLWFATSDGIAAIDPRHLPTNAVPPPIAIQAAMANNQSLDYSAALHLRPRNIEIGFAVLSFPVPERVLCRYKLEDYESDWHGPVATRSATYTNLPPGKYKFRVIASNDDGVWNENGTTLPFEIIPRFYETGWFLLLCSLAGVLSIWFVYRWRLRFVTARLNFQYVERLSERERIARDLHDTLLQSVQGVMLSFQAVTKEIPDHQQARGVLERVLDRADEVIAEGRRIIAGLRTFQRDCDLSEDLANAARAFAGGSQPQFRLVVEGTVRPLHPMVRDEAYRIGREAIANAFLHAGSRNLEVEITYLANELRVRIQDDGCGIHPQTLVSGGKPSHWGLRGMRERARSIRSRLSIRSGIDCGTEIELRVPGVVAYDGFGAKFRGGKVDSVEWEENADALD
jgi:signal transduction histidine kinase/ligand-binding sensor domain-containing protein